MVGCEGVQVSEELEQLKDDLAKLLEAAKIYDARYKGADWKATLGIIESRIARLEAEQADPWREAKEAINYWSDNAGYSALWAREAKVIAYVNHLTAENDRLAARVANLENEPEPAKVALKRAEEIKAGDVILAGGYIQTVTAIEPESTQRIIKCDGWMAWFRNNENVAVINGDDDPILAPARVLATAAKVYSEKGMNSIASMCRFDSKDAKPYRLKGGGQ